jgi:putative transposase
VNNSDNKIIVLEQLSTKNMTKKPKPKPNDRGGWDNNNAKAKAGLNKNILDKGWHQLGSYIAYKSQQAGKAFFKVDAKYTSQAFAACEHTHPDNRKTQALFVCGKCGNADNADRNAARVIKKRAIALILHAGTALSKQGVLTACKDKGRGATHKPAEGIPSVASCCESPKKKRKAATLDLVA